MTLPSPNRSTWYIVWSIMFHSTSIDKRASISTWQEKMTGERNSWHMSISHSTGTTADVLLSDMGQNVKCLATGCWAASDCNIIALSRHQYWHYCIAFSVVMWFVWITADVAFLYPTNRGRKKEMFYLTTHSTNFIYSYTVSGIW